MSVLHNDKKTSSGLALHSSNVALTPARALTSHVRKHYHERYVGRFRYASIVFAVDAVLSFAVLVLLVVNISLRLPQLFHGPIGLDLTLHSDVLVAGAVTPLEARIRVLDGKQHENVHVVWHLPPWVEVIRAEPPLNRDGMALLGSISPTQTVSSRLYVRIHALPGTDVPFAFILHDGIGVNERTMSGRDNRRVVRSALTIVPALPLDAVQPGASIPFIVTNSSALEAQSVIVRLDAADGAPQSTLSDNAHIGIGTMRPGEQTIIFLQVDPAAKGDLHFVLNVEDMAHTVSTYDLAVQATTSLAVLLNEPLRSMPGTTSTDLIYESATTAGVWVWHPLQQTVGSSTSRTYDLAPGNGRIHIPLQRTQRSSETTWSVIPYEKRNGQIVLGERIVGILSTAFPFHTEARYYSSSGDQLGVGPLPPRVDEATTYWVVWSVGPIDADLKDLYLETTLAENVRATGKFASQIPGDFSTQEGRVSWSIPSLPATGSTPATFAFEIRYTPMLAQKGAAHILTKTSSASAIEVRSGLSLQAISDAQDTNINQDVQGQGKGKVE